MRKLTFLLFFFTMCVSCIYIPKGGSKPCLSASREQSIKDGFYICDYKADPDSFCYVDSLITIKIHILDAYSEEVHSKKWRFPPYLFPHYYKDTNSFKLVFYFEYDSSTTKTYRDFDEYEHDWWRLNMDSFVSTEMCDEYYSQDTHISVVDDWRLIWFGNLKSLDTLYLPIVFGQAYRDKIWPNHNIKDEVLIGKIRFIRDKKPGRDFDSVQEKFNRLNVIRSERDYKIWYEYLKTTHEMDSLYGIKKT